MSVRLLKKPVTKTSQRVLEQLVAGLDVGDSKKFDNGAPFMAVHVEALQRTSAGVLYSVAHYFEANGDLVCDPDVVFLRRTDGSFCPVSFQNSMETRARLFQQLPHEVLVTFDPHDRAKLRGS